MGFDGKYGKVTTQFGDIPDDEPVFLFRAKDRLLVPLLDHYLELCDEAESTERHMLLVRQARDRIAEWQDANPTRTPVSEGPAGRDLDGIRPMPGLNHPGSDRWTGGDRKDAP
jgi:hypothetical protein